MIAVSIFVNPRKGEGIRKYSRKYNIKEFWKVLLHRFSENIYYTQRIELTIYNKLLCKKYFPLKLFTISYSVDILMLNGT